jgi:hypothetical protein
MTPTPNMNLTKSHHANKIIRSKEKGIMTRNIVHEKLCLICQIEPKSANEACNYDHWIQAMKEELDHIVKNYT